MAPLKSIKYGIGVMNFDCQPNREKALFYAQKTIAQIVTNVVNLEDINFTVPEVQTLLDGITVGGHKIQDELITINQIKAWQYLFDSLKDKSFCVSLEYILKLHGLVANQEALTWGEFRSGQVSISGTEYMPPKFSELHNIFMQLISQIKNIYHLQENLSSQDKTKIIYQYATQLFAQMARTQFFYDGNKRTARMMMSGILIDLGYPMINVSAKYKAEFNHEMINYYNTQKLEPLQEFLISCLDPWIIEEFSNKVITQMVNASICAKNKE